MSLLADLVTLKSVQFAQLKKVDQIAKNRARELREANQISELIADLCPTRREEAIIRRLSILKKKIKEVSDINVADALTMELKQSSSALDQFRSVYACNSRSLLSGKDHTRSTLIHFTPTIEQDARSIAIFLSRQRTAKQLSAWDRQTILWIALNVNDQAVSISELQRLFHLQEKPTHGPQASWAYFNKRVMDLKQQLAEVVDRAYDGETRDKIYKKMDHLCNTGQKKALKTSPESPSSSLMTINQISGATVQVIGEERDGCAYDALKKNLPLIQEHFPMTEFRSKANGFVFLNRQLDSLSSTLLPPFVKSEIQWFAAKCLHLFGDVVVLSNNHDKHTVNENMSRMFVLNASPQVKAKRFKGVSGARDVCDDKDPYRGLVDQLLTSNMEDVDFTQLSEMVVSASECTWIGQKKRHNRGEDFWLRHNEVLVFLALKWMMVIYTKRFCRHRNVDFRSMQKALSVLNDGKPSYQHTASVRKGIFHDHPSLAQWMKRLLPLAGLNPLVSFRIECSCTISTSSGDEVSAVLPSVMANGDCADQDRQTKSQKR